MLKLKIILPFTLASLALAGCSLAPRYHRPDEKLPTTLGDNKPTAQNVSIDKWWESFHDPVLNKLVEQALTRNTDLLQAYGRIKEARAALGIKNADYFPSLNAESTNLRKETATSQLISPEQPRTGNVFYEYASLSYEVDLFGRIRSENLAARQDLIYAEYSTQSMRSLVAAQTATTYFNLVAAREQLAITQKSVETRRDTLKVEEKRYAAGYASDADRQSAVAELSNAEVMLPDLQKAVETYQSALRIMVGEGADEIWSAKPMTDVPNALPEPPAVALDVLPATLLERRPDIMAAEAELKSANYLIGEARAERLPTISISAVLGTADGRLNNLFRHYSRTWTLTGDAATPVFNFGRNANNVRSAKAAAEVARINYQAVVRNAFKELRDAATDSELSRQSVEARTRQVDAWNRNLEIAQNMFRTGYTDPLDLQDAERGQMAAQLSLVDARLDRLVATVNLCRALGGGWESSQVRK